jgi:hypothetical protein
MKAISSTLTAVAAALMIVALPVQAEDNVMGQQEPQVQKNECLLVAQNCPTDTIQQRIQRIQDVINRGAAVYTNDELRQMERALDSYKKELNFLEHNERPVLGS